MFDKISEGKQLSCFTKIGYKKWEGNVKSFKCLKINSFSSKLIFIGFHKGSLILKHSSFQLIATLQNMQWTICEYNSNHCLGIEKWSDMTNIICLTCKNSCYSRKILDYNWNTSDTCLRLSIVWERFKNTTNIFTFLKI